LGFEPAFSRQSWPVSGLRALPVEPDDPRLGIPGGALALGIRDRPDTIVLRSLKAEIETAPGVPLVAPEKAPRLARKWKLALVASCVLHAAIAVFFIVKGDEPVLIEGAQETGSVVLGNASESQLANGEPLDSDPNTARVTLLTMIEATPVETLNAREVASEAETVGETAAAETLEPVEETLVAEATSDVAEPAMAQAAPEVTPDTSQPAMAEPQTPAATSEVVPEVLTAERNDPPNENTVVQPQDEVSPTPPVETTDAEIVESAETQAAPPTESQTSLQSETIAPDTEVTLAEPTETVTEVTGEVQSAEVQPPEEPVEAQPAEPPAPVTPETITAEMMPTERPEPPETKPEPKAAEKSEPKKPETRKAEPRKIEQKTAEKPARPKETRTAKADEKTQTRTEKGGSGGKNSKNANKGAANGERDGTGLNKGKGGRSGSGNAAVSNYPGKVAAKLRRAARGISRSTVRKAKNDVQVGFTVSAGGSVSGVRITRSSGSPELDQMALAVVRRAAPFPPIPDGAGRSTWAFAMPLGIAR
jgi:protein TonB